MSLILTPETLQKTLGYTFRQISLLQEALSHPSRGGKLFERLEFLGDRLLGLAIADLLYHRFPDVAEGQLAKRLAILVSHDSLFYIGKAWDLHYSSQSMVEDTVEAVLGAIYLDGGWDPVKACVELHWQELLEKELSIDPKTLLQEYLQAHDQDLPRYEVVSSQGPSHAPLFFVQVKIGDHLVFEGRGLSKRKAEFEAAASALKTLCP